MNMDLILRQWKYALEFYANPVNHVDQDADWEVGSIVNEDKGELARKALALLE